MILIVTKLIKKLRRSFFNKIFLVKITGFSLFPDLIPGKFYLAHNFGKLKPGDFVIFKFNEKIFVKKILVINHNDILVGDNLDQQFMINKYDILGKIIFFF